MRDLVKTLALTDDTSSLKRLLRRSRQIEQLKAAALVAPLLLFLLATFVVPIGALLTRGVLDPEVPKVLPTVTRELAAWDGEDLPGEAAFAALIADMREARAAGTLASAATRLNYDINGFRSLMFSAARRLPETLTQSARDTLIGIDPKWGERETWAAIRRAGGPVTDFYLLAAADLRHGADGIEQVPAEQAVFRNVLGRTFWISGVVTLACVLLGYPLAYLAASLPARHANLLLLFVLLPFWTSLLVRTAAWVVVLQREGVANAALLAAGLIEQPLRMIFNRFGVYVAMVHILLPFMVLPLYSVMKSVPPAYVRAAASLGASPWTAFRRVYLPQTLPGLSAGCLLVFVQALGYYITPALVGGAEDQMISYLIAFYASRTINWGMAAALSIILLAATLVLCGVYGKLVGFEKVKV
ncbi:MAG TPA: ABC transporter permease [Alphaproteobacteria bacterium]|nr:ABC transporter permease [Alphaproteobacteria bacterium]